MTQYSWTSLFSGKDFPPWLLWFPTLSAPVGSVLPLPTSQCPGASVLSPLLFLPSARAQIFKSLMCRMVVLSSQTSPLRFVCAQSHFSHVWLCVTAWTAARQALYPWDSPGKNTGVGCYTLLQGIFPHPGIELTSLKSLALTVVFFTASTTWEAPSKL